MLDRRAAQMASLLWAMAGFAVAAASLATVETDAIPLVGAASVVFPLCAVLAAFALGQGLTRAAGVLLLASVATPTYFAWPLNVLALLLGLALLLAPRLVVRAGQ